LQRALDAFFTRTADKVSTDSRHSPEKLVYLLDHQYTRRSLSWSRFKGVDKARADAMKAAADALDMHVSLCLVDINELWSAYEKNDSDYNGFYGGYDRYDEDSDYEDEPADASDTEAASNARDEYELQELIEGSVTLTHWSSGDNAQYPTLNVGENELCWTRASDEFSPVSEEYEGYMGNYGNTLDRQYQRAAVVIWPKSMHLRTLFRMDGVTGMRALLSLARVDPSAAAREAIVILDTLWPDTPQLTSAASLSATIKLLLLLGDSSLSRRALAAFQIDAVNKTQMRPLINLGVEHGNAFCEQLISSWIEPQGRRYQYVSLGWIEQLPHFCEQVNLIGGSAWKRVPERLWYFYFGKLTEQHENDSRDGTPSDRLADSNNQVTHLLALYRSAQCLSSRKAMTKLLLHVHNKQRIYHDKTLVSFLEALSELKHDSPRVRALRTLNQRLAGKLSARLAKPMRASDDWRMSVEIECHCADCGSLSKFLTSSEQHHSMPLAKNRRLHVHRVIDSAELPVSHATLRKGSPFVLQLVKKRLLFKIEKQQRELDLALLKKVESLDFE
jgi:hypothetical protein